MTTPLPRQNEGRSVRVFVSSTFRDMGAERDVLVTVVFPELRERLEWLGLDFFDVDLRWGVPLTGVDGERSNSWAYCRQWIDRVEPFFVGILGERYGWPLPADEIKDEDDRQAFAGQSITEMEIRHAVLRGSARHRSFFYLRKPKVPKDGTDAAVYERFVDGAAQSQLEALKDAIRRTGRPVRSYPCQWAGDRFEDLDTFGAMVLEDLWSGVLRDDRYVSAAVWRDVLGHDPATDELYADDSRRIPQSIWERVVERAKPASADPLEAEAAQMAAFASGRLRWFRGRKHELGALRGFVEGALSPDASRLCVVHAEAGAGKSALLAKLAEDLAPSPHLVLTHFVGATERSADARSLLERMLKELDRNGVPQGLADAKTDFESLRRQLAACLGQYRGTRRILLVIDGVDQLTDGRDMSWLPSRLGEEVRVIVSCIDSPGAPDTSTESHPMRPLSRRTPATHMVNVRPLAESDVRQIVTEFLDEYCKELDQSDENAIVRLPQASNPLYLLVLLHELRTLGGDSTHLKVREIIADLPTHRPDLVSLFDWMLERLEAFGKEAVRRWWVYLSLSRIGMSSKELSALLGRTLGDEGSSAALRIERTVRRYLQRRGGQWDTFHGQLREAAIRRYGPPDPTAHHAEIAALFRTRWRNGDHHAISELPFHEVRGNLWDAVETTLCDLPFIAAKCAAGMTYSLVQDYDLALTASADAKDEQDLALQRRDRLDQYTHDLHAYAKGDVTHLDVIDSIEPWSDTRLRAETDRISHASTRLDRLRAFSHFVGAEQHQLLRYATVPGFCIQQALNSADRGPVVEIARRTLNAEPDIVAFTLHSTSLAAFRPFAPVVRVISFGTDNRPGASVSSVVGIDHAGELAFANGSLWDITSGRLVRTIGNPSECSQSAVTPDGRTGLSGGYERALLWDLISGDVRRRLHRTGEVFAVDITPDGRIGVSGGADREVSVWDLDRGTRLCALDGHKSYVFAVRIAPRAHRAVSGSHDNTVRSWSLERRVCERVLEGHSHYVTAIDITPDGLQALSGSWDQSLRLWDLESGECVQVLNGHQGLVMGVALTPDGRRAVSVGSDQTLCAWNLQTGSVRRVDLIVPEPVGVRIAADGTRAVSVHRSALCVLDLERGL